MSRAGGDTDQIALDFWERDEGGGAGLRFTLLQTLEPDSKVFQ
jgi:hypothetical protein